MSNLINEVICECGFENKLQENSEQYDFFVDDYPEKKVAEYIKKILITPLSEQLKEFN